MTEKKHRRPAIPTWARWSVSTVIIVLILTQIDVPSLGRMLWNANPAWLALALLMIFFEQVAMALSWRAMLSSRGYGVPFLKMIHIIFVANFIGFVFPSSTGSDVVKVIGLSKYISSAAQAFTSMFVFRVAGYLILFLIALAAAVLFADRLPDTPVVAIISKALVIGLALGALGVMFAKPALRLAKIMSRRYGFENFYHKLETLYDSFWFYVRHKKAMATALAGAFFIQVDRIVFVYVIALALGLEVNPVALCVFVPIITTMTVIPVSISGIGVREGGYVLLFTHIGLTASQAVSLSICGFALDMGYVLLGGVVYQFFGFPEQKRLETLKGQESAQ